MLPFCGGPIAVGLFEGLRLRGNVMLDQSRQRNLAEVYSVLGNALLTVPTDPGLPYLAPAFWVSFPAALTNENILKGLNKVTRYLGAEASSCDESTERTALEYTRLFIGPPEPVAAPWESLNRGGEGSIGYGKPAFAMAKLLAEKGLEISNDNNQYPDHLGIELLLLTYLCEKQVSNAGEVTDAEVLAFIEEHPLGWVAVLREKVEKAYPEGFYAGLLLLVEGTLRWHRDALVAEV